MSDRELKCAHVRSEHFSEAATCALDPIGETDLQALTVRARLCPLCAGRVHGTLARLGKFGTMIGDDHGLHWLNAYEVTQPGLYLWKPTPVTPFAQHVPLQVCANEDGSLRVVVSGLLERPLQGCPGRFFGPIPNDDPGPG